MLAGPTQYSIQSNLRQALISDIIKTMDDAGKGNQGSWTDQGDQDIQADTGSQGTTGMADKPASSASKEGEPVVSVKEAPGEHKEFERRKEVGEFVKPAPVWPEIPPEIEKAGAAHTGPTAPINGKKQAKKIQLPLTDEEIEKGLHAHVWQSIRWLAVWCVREWKMKAHTAIKVIHGKLVGN